MTTYYCHTLEDTLKRAKAAEKRPGYHYGGVSLRSGKKGLAIYREGKVIELYSVIGEGTKKEKPIIISTWAVVESYSTRDVIKICINLYSKYYLDPLQKHLNTFYQVHLENNRHHIQTSFFDVLQILHRLNHPGLGYNHTRKEE